MYGNQLLSSMNRDWMGMKQQQHQQQQDSNISTGNRETTNTAGAAAGSRNDWYWDGQPKGNGPSR